MKERPIIFTAESVRAILDGRKMQTRRVIVPQPQMELDHSCRYTHADGRLEYPVRWFWFDADRINGKIEFAREGQTSTTRQRSKAAKWLYRAHDGKTLWAESEIVSVCPYGVRGDRLWVKETWMPAKTSGYDAPGDGRTIPFWYRATDEGEVDGKWKSLRFMPRWASRLTLEIVSVRVERVREISRDDAIAEGASDQWTDREGRMCHFVPQEWFMNLWDSINAERGYGWNENPWVFVIEFKRVKP